MRLLFRCLVAGLVLGTLAHFAIRAAWPRDLGQWENVDPAVKQWFRDLKQPDHPLVSCCGEADAYWADSYEVDKYGHYVAIITDERPDGPLGRPHILVGTKVVVPDAKIKWDRGNPTGHGIIFLSDGSDEWGGGGEWIVYCYLPPTGA